MQKSRNLYENKTKTTFLERRGQKRKFTESAGLTEDDRFFRQTESNYFESSHHDDCKNEIEKSFDDQIEECVSESETPNNLNNDHDSDEDDPLDAYMKSLEAEPQCANQVPCKPEPIPDIDTSITKLDKGVRLDIDSNIDTEESYYNHVNQQQKKHTDIDTDDREDLVEYDQEGNIICVRKGKKEIEPLPSIDHSELIYKDFDKCFYNEHQDIANLTQELVDQLRTKLDIKVTGLDIPKPVCSFAHFGFEEKLLRTIRKSEYTSPTPIQAQAIPAALSGRNILGIAMTGSGKTAAYIWPMIVHIAGQPNLEKDDGPIGLILVPTRELALQVHTEAKRFSSAYKINVVCAYGGGSKYEQSKELASGAEIVVATPGRLIDLIKMNMTNLKRVTYLVLDEADRFFDMGFEMQVRSICDYVRPDRQTLLFSATFKKKIEKLARSIISNPIKIFQKTLGEANEDVTQHVVLMKPGTEKWKWLVEMLEKFRANGSSIIFVNRIVNSEELHENMKNIGYDNLLLHGDMDQSERNRVMKAFKKKDKDLMIATDVAARGLDISHIKTVINYDVPRDIDTHVHRIGRTGRAGNKGDAYTLLTMKDKDFAGHLVKNLEASNQIVPDDLQKLAMQGHLFRKQHSQQNRGGHHNLERQSSYDRRDWRHNKVKHHTQYGNTPNDIPCNNRRDISHSYRRDTINYHNYLPQTSGSSSSNQDQNNHQRNPNHQHPFKRY